MIKLVDGLRRIRASNIIFLFMIPIIVYFLITSRNYLPALISILGVEENALQLLASFIVLSTTALLTFSGALYLLKSIRIDQKINLVIRCRKLAPAVFTLAFILGLVFHFCSILDTYAISVLANSSDPRTSDWIIVVDQSFTLSSEFKIVLLNRVEQFETFLTFTSLICLIFSVIPLKYHKSNAGRFIIFLIILISFFSSFYILMIAHAGFAVGLMVTLRAAFFAYLGASALGLLWALLTNLTPSRRATYIHTSISLLLICIGFVLFVQKHKEVALIGNLTGKIGIIAGTPQWVADHVRYGDFLEITPKKPFKIRSLRDATQALSLLEKQSISGLIVPLENIGSYPVLWKSDYLPSHQKNMAIASTSIGFLILLLVGIGNISNLHPLAVFSDFFVDTIRGIPMIVIILYIGLPLAGALKSASGGYMNIEMMTRGIIAIAIGYSAYMAEIFRAGIEAIPRGQIEAARTLGLREHHVARFVIIPQAIAIVLPALGNEFIAMLKDTSLLSILSIRDVTQRMKEFQAQSFLAFEPFNTAALLYVFLTLLAASGIKALDNIVNKNRASEKQ